MSKILLVVSITLILAVVASVNASPSLQTGSWNISSGTLTSGVSIGDNGVVYVSSLSFFAAGNWTINLTVSATDVDRSLLSTTAIVVESGDVYEACATADTKVTATSSSVVITNIVIGPDAAPFATETWSVSLQPSAPLTENGTKLMWSVSRKWTSAVNVISDRQGLTMTMTGSAPIHGNQIPSFLDTDMFMNDSTGSGFELPNKWFEFGSPSSSQTIVFSPVYAVVSSSVTSVKNIITQPAFFSYAKPYCDGTCGYSSLGLNLVDRRLEKSVSMMNGDETQTVWSFVLLNEGVTPLSNRFPSLNIKLPESLAALETSTKLFAKVHNQFLGYVFGNNPASVPCLQEMAFFPWIQGMFDATNIPNGLRAVQKEIEFFSTKGMDSQSGGTFFSRWASSGFYNPEWGPMNDQTPNYVIAVHSLGISTGDKAWLTAQLPSLERILNYTLITCKVLEKGVFVDLGASGLPDGLHHASNWFDIIEFGNMDAYNSMYTALALEGAADIYAFLGNTERAAYYKDLHEKTKNAINNIFWNQSLSRYYDWIDVNGLPRNYTFVDIDLLAIIGGVASKDQGQAFINLLDERYAALTKQYNLTTTDIWSIPCNLFPITLQGDSIIGSGATFPNYENGGSFFREIGYEAMGRAMLSNGDAAMSVFSKFMDNGFSINRGWAQQLYWNTGELVGGDPLNNSLVALYGWLRGSFGVRAKLSGVTSPNPPAKALEGATWTFVFKGQNLCVTVKGGVTCTCDGAMLPKEY